MSEPFLGEVKPVPFGFVPAGWAACQGQLLPVAGNSALSFLLGTAYGGDGRNNFGLPDLPPLKAKGGATLQYCIALRGIMPQRR